MAEMTFKLTIDPILNTQKLNAILSELSKSLGSLGKDIKPIDEARLTAALKSIESEAKRAEPVLEQTFKAPADDIAKLNSGIDSVEKNLQKMPAAVQKTSSSLSSMIGGVFGGNLLYQGFEKLIGSFNDVIQRGFALDQTMDVIGTAFAQAGVPVEKTAEVVQDVMNRSADLANTYAYPVEKLNEFAATAAALGGATGKTNEDLVKLGMAINEVTNGMIDGNMAIRIFSKGVADPESQMAMSKLTARFPALGAALKDIKDPAMATAKALEVLNPTLESMKDMGANDALVVFKNNIKQLQDGISKVLLTAIVPLMNSFKSTIMPILQTIANGLGSLSNAFKPIMSTIAPVIVVFGGLTTAMIAAATAVKLYNAAMATGGILQIAGQWINSLKMIIVQTYQQVAAQGLLNTVMSINPYVLAIAGITALVGGLHLLSDALHQTAAERAEELEAEKKAMNSQVEIANKQLEAAKSKADLIKQFEAEGDAAMNNANLLRQLAEKYPGVIDMTKSYSENLINLKNKTSETNTEITKHIDTITNLKEKQANIDVKIGFNKVDVAKEKVEDQLVKSFGNVLNSASEFLFGTSTVRKNAEALVKTYSDAMYKAKNSTELLKAQNDFYNDLYNTNKFKDFNSTQKQQFADAMDAMFKAQGEALQAAKEKNAKILDIDLTGMFDKAFSGAMPTAQEFQDIIKKTGGDATGAFDAIVKMGANLIDSGKDADKVYEILSKTTGKTPEELKKAVAQQQQLTREIDASKFAMMSLSDITGELTKAQQNARGEIIKAIAQLKAGKISQQEYNSIVSKQKEIIKNNAQEMKNFNNAAKDKTVLDINKMIIKDETGITEQKKATNRATKETITLYEQLKKTYEAQIEEARNAFENEKLIRELNQLQSNVNLTLHEQNLQKLSDAAREVEMNKQNLDAFQKVYDAAQKQYEIEEKKGKITDKTKQNYDDAKKSIENLNKTLLQSQISQKKLIIQTQIDEEKYKSDLNKLKSDFTKANIEFKIKVGLATQTDLLKYQVDEINRQIQELLNQQITVGIDEKTYRENNNKILNLQTQLYDAKHNLDIAYEKDKINLINDSNERIYKLQELQAKETLHKEIIDAGNNNDAKLDAYIKYYSSLAKLEVDYFARIHPYQQMLVNTATNLADAFSNMKITFDDKSVNDAKSKLDEQQKALTENLKNQKITYAKFVDEMATLDKQRKEQVIKTNNEIIDAINNALKDAFAKTIEVAKNTLKTSLQQYNDYTTSIIAIDKQKEEIKKQSDLNSLDGAVDYFKKTADLQQRSVELTKKAEDAKQQAYIQAATIASAAFMQMVADGKSATKALVIAALEGLKAIAPIYVARILGEEFATKGPVGIGTAAMLTALLYAAIGTAEAAVSRAKFYKGVVNLQGSGSSYSDSIPAQLSRGESVIPASVTKKNIKELNYLLQNNTSLINYYKYKEPEALKQAYYEIATAKDFLKFAPVMNLILEERKIDNNEIRILKSELQTMNQKLDLLTSINQNIERGNYSRKTNTSVDLNLEINDKELIQRVKRQDLMSVRRS